MNDRQLLVIERDNHGDDLTAPRFKKVFLLDLSRAAENGGYVGKTLLARPPRDPRPGRASAATATSSASRSTPSSRSTWWTSARCCVASDNNFPFSNGRARSRSVDRRGPLAADDTELVLVRLGTPLDVDPRLLPAAIR